MLRWQIIIAIGALMTGSVYGKTSLKEVDVGIVPYYQPFEFYQEEAIVGFDVDLIHAIAKELDWKITFKPMPFEDLIPSLKRHDVDLAISGINMIPERLEEIDFSQSYHQPHSLVWVYLSDHTFPEHSKFTNVGVQRGTYLETWVNNQQKIMMNFQIKVFSSTPELFDGLINKKVDMVVVEEIQAEQYSKAHPGKIHYRVSETMIEGYGVAFPKGSSLTKEVNMALEKLASTGAIKALREKWLHKNEA